MKLSEISSKIKNRETVRVTGLVDYSHIASKIDGEELAKANSYTKFPSNTPYYKLAIQITAPVVSDAFIYDKANESATYLAAYLASRVYESKKEENKGKKFLSLTSKGNEIPIYKKDENNKLHAVKLNGNELAPGSNVEIEVVYFETKMGAGVGINAVIVCDPEIKVFTGNVGVTGYELAEDTISLPPRQAKAAPDVTAATGIADETPVSDGEAGAGVEVDSDPVGSSAAPSNENFDALLAKFKAGGN